MRLARRAGVLTCGMLGLAAVACVPAATAQPKCFFLECGPGDSKPAPQPKPVSTDATTQPRPQAQLARPSSATETCQRVAGDHTYCVSSVLAPQFGFSYRPVNLTDNRLDTAWVEGVSGDGIGEWLVAIPAKGTRLRGFEILNGYHKNSDLFHKNNRVRDIELTLANGHRQTITLADQAGPQRFTFPASTPVDWVQFRIKSVYSGTKYQDTAITELHLMTD